MQDAGLKKPRLLEAEETQQQIQCPCPRCESPNTKFCYYNNYNLSQPRHFCKDCRRYWTQGGSLRNVPIGGATRKSHSTKRSSSSSSSSSNNNNNNPKRQRLSASSPPPVSYPTTVLDSDDGRMLEITGSFSSLLASSGDFGSSFLDQHYSFVVPGLEVVERSSENQTAVKQESGVLSSQGGDYGYWSSGWPELSIYTPPGLGFNETN